LQLKINFLKYSGPFLVAAPIGSLLQRKEVKLQVPDETPSYGNNKHNHHHHHYPHRISHFSALAGKYSFIVGSSNQQD